MRRIVLTTVAMSALATAAGAWTVKGSSRADLWLSQPGYALAYREVLDLGINGSLDDQLSLSAGIRYQLDQESWDDTTSLSGITKKHLLLETERLSLRLGNYYGSLGRGLALNCVSDERLKLDRDIEGGYLKAEPSGWLEVRGMAGRAYQNSALLDERNLIGGEAVCKPTQHIGVGGIYLRANAAGQPSQEGYNLAAEESFGGNLAINLFSAEFYGEYIQRHTYGINDPSLGWIGADDIRGKGFYGWLGWTASGVGVAVDFKDYRNLDSPISGLPPCNRDGRLMNRGYDEQGWQVEITTSPREFLEVKGNYSSAGGDLSDWRWQDLFCETNWDITSRWKAGGEIRIRAEEMLEAEVTARKYRGAGVQAQWRYNELGSIKLRLDGDRRQNRYLLYGQLPHDLVRTEAGWSPFPLLQVFAEAEISSRRLPDYQNQRRWGRAGAVLKIGESHKLEVSVGHYKGGLVCSGGFCRYEPPFRGMKTTWQWSL